MATATINGTPSVFITPEPLPEILPTYPVRVKTFTEISSEMASESVIDPEADLLNDPEFQESYNEWCEKLDAEWRNDPEAQRKFEEWCNEQERIEKEEAEKKEAELETLEHEAYEADLERQAEAAELARLGDAYLEAINGADLKWQAGVA